MKKILAVFTAILLLISMCGCASAVALLMPDDEPVEDTVSVPEPTTDVKTTPVPKKPSVKPTESPEVTPEPTPEPTPVPEQSEASKPASKSERPKKDPPAQGDPSLVSLRQAMIGTPEVFAVAYFGFVEEYTGDTETLLRNRCPELTEDLPFVTQIPEGNIIGEHGEMYCIVPTDENATVAVNLLSQDTEGNVIPDEVLYRSEAGEPIILFCNYGGFYPDCVVYITDSEGNSTEFYPQLDMNGVCAVPENENGYLVGFDFSDYAGIYGEYFFWLNYGWLPPLEAGLDATTWALNTVREDGVEATLMLDLRDDGTASFLWILDGESREFVGDWTVEESDENSLLTLDLYDGEEYFFEQYPVLIDMSGTSLILFNGLEGTYLPIDEAIMDPMVFSYSEG